MKTYKVLTIKQPWAHLIIAGIKPVENRSWRTEYRGTILIHAGKEYDKWDAELEYHYGIHRGRLAYGAVIGSVDLVDIVTEHCSPFFVGPFGWVLENPRQIEPIPLRGQLRLFNAALKLPRQSRRK